MPLTEHFRDFIQIAGIHDRDEAELIMASGVKYLGFPLRLPVNQEDLSEAAAARIVRALRPPCFGVAITYQNRADDIAAFMDFIGAAVLQLHGDIGLDQLRRLRRDRPSITVIKSLVVGEGATADLFAAARRLAPHVDAFITDTFDPATGASGATGRTHDWQISRQLVALCPKPVILAGGLTPDNVCEAILSVRPTGVDAHTGVEAASGRKDRGKVRRFVTEAQRGFELVRKSG